MTMLTAMSEDTRIAELVDRLRTSYPTLPADIVVEVVNDMRAAFHGSRIREYVPLFVERRARSALTELAV
jgi:hypothetical protein